MPYLTYSSLSGPLKEAGPAGPAEQQETLVDLRKRFLVESGRPLAIPESAAAIRSLAGMSESTDGKLHICGFWQGRPECSPDDETVNAVMSVGFDGCPGTVDIASCPALGLRWRLSPDHPLIVDYPQLSQFEAPDMPVEMAPPGKTYIPAARLGEAMAAAQDFAGLDENVASFIGSLARFSLRAVPAKLYMGEWVYYVQNGFDSFGIEAYSPGPKPRHYEFEASQPVATLRFLLSREGLKTVDVSGREPRDLPPGPEHNLAQTAAKLGKQIRLFTRNG